MNYELHAKHNEKIISKSMLIPGQKDGKRKESLPSIHSDSRFAHYSQTSLEETSKKTAVEKGEEALKSK